jgi:hypothetical protein
MIRPTPFGVSCFVGMSWQSVLESGLPCSFGYVLFAEKEQDDVLCHSLKTSSSSDGTSRVRTYHLSPRIGSGAGREVEKPNGARSTAGTRGA